MMHLQNAKLPRFRFDYDPALRKLFLVANVQRPAAEHIPELVYENCESPEMARLIVTAWCGGYLAKERERFDPKAPQHHRMVAEAGIYPLSLAGR